MSNNLLDNLRLGLGLGRGAHDEVAVLSIGWFQLRLSTFPLASTVAVTSPVINALKLFLARYVV